MGEKSTASYCSFNNRGSALQNGAMLAKYDWPGVLEKLLIWIWVLMFGTTLIRKSEDNTLYFDDPWHVYMWAILAGFTGLVFQMYQLRYSWERNRFLDTITAAAKVPVDMLYRYAKDHVFQSLVYVASALVVVIVSLNLSRSSSLVDDMSLSELFYVPIALAGAVGTLRYGSYLYQILAVRRSANTDSITKATKQG